MDGLPTFEEFEKDAAAPQWGSLADASISRISRGMLGRGVNQAGAKAREMGEKARAAYDARSGSVLPPSTQRDTFRPARVTNQAQAYRSGWKPQVDPGRDPSQGNQALSARPDHASHGWKDPFGSFIHGANRRAASTEASGALPPTHRGGDPRRADPRRPTAQRPWAAGAPMPPAMGQATPAPQARPWNMGALPMLTAFASFEPPTREEFEKLAYAEPEWESPVEEHSHAPAAAVGALAGLAAQRKPEIERARRLYGKHAPQHVPNMLSGLKRQHALGPAVGGLLFAGGDWLARQGS